MPDIFSQLDIILILRYIKILPNCRPRTTSVVFWGLPLSFRLTLSISMFWSEEPLAFDPALGVVCICLKTGATVTAACSNFNVCSSITCKFFVKLTGHTNMMNIITFTEAQKFWQFFLKMKKKIVKSHRLNKTDLHIQTQPGFVSVSCAALNCV